MFNESGSFMYTHVYKITSKYYFNTYLGLHPLPTTRVSGALANLATQDIICIYIAIALAYGSNTTGKIGITNMIGLEKINGYLV